MSETIILTLFDRSHLILLNTFMWLKTQKGIGGMEVLVVNDGSTMDYSEIKRQLAGEFKLTWIDVDTVKDKKAYHINGHTNPAYANNVALEAAKGDVLYWVSSDTMLQPNLIKRARGWDLSRYVYTPKVVNLADGKVFNGRQRIFPMCWFVACRKEDCKAVGGFDEEYLKGMAFEDNDFMGRLGLHVGSVVIDTGTCAWHQPHAQTAYSDDWRGFKRSQEYTLKKWDGGVPWSYRGNPNALEQRSRVVADCIVVEVKKAWKAA